jgi:hypothetical protein
MQFPHRNSILFLSLLAALAISGAACTRPTNPAVAHEPHAPPMPATAAFGRTILRVGKSVTFTDGLTVELKDINDSRCPAKVQCVWAGELTANLAVHGGDLGGQVQNVSLGALTAKNRTVASYDFVLADASPSTATVIVTKPGSVANAAGIKSGVHGVVTAGPTCPVERMPPDPSCADRPQAAMFSIDTLAGTHVAEVSSGADGEFTMLLPAGTYVISLRGTAALPSMAAQTFVVSGNKYTELSLKLDSGIR